MENVGPNDIVFADDDPAMREMVGEVLRSAGFRARLIADASAALEQIRHSPPDLVILDYRMGPPDGLAICRGIKSDPRLEHLPVLILTAEGSVEDRIQGFEAGANDYLAKPFDARELLARVRALLMLTRQGLERNPTSGLPGGEAIQREIERRRELGEPYSVCYLDLDHFKPFGDRFGFALGNQVIQDVGRVLGEVAEPDSFCGHVGGDDFILITGRQRARAQVEAAQGVFRERLARLLPPQVVAAGAYQSVDRDGRSRRFPLTRLAAAIVHLSPSTSVSVEELGEKVAAAKSRAKQSTGSGIEEMEI